ncbi:GNAT family N-acetyltransferase [Dyadobacter luticola]|uniref:GNAT family N-acetyltransferase n=1 Tax=Dyadobacter luticola TaxID=1979387 RepID=A0A5R9KYS7_9BACT|nr:GNAT family N-acetyltransferase [Dyadobacter luticola]TLV01331.1 GNAT family N-acetyltransferase [Dyadobacter luticola]
MKIRMAKDADLPQILEIWYEGLADHFPELNGRERYSKKFSANFKTRADFHFWVAEKNEILIAYQSHLPATNHPAKFDFYAETSIYVRRSYRGSRAAFYLYRNSLDYLKQHTDITFLIGYIALENSAALRLATHFGYEIVGNIGPAKKNAFEIGERLIVVNNLCKIEDLQQDPFG